MSDIDSTAATRATPVSPTTRYADQSSRMNQCSHTSYSHHASPEPSQDASASHARSPSPAGRSPKRRRLDSSFPENRYDENHFNHAEGSGHYSSPHLASQSAPNVPILLNGAGPFEPQPRTFLGHDREFMSHILSTRGVVHRGRATTRHRQHNPGSRFGVEDLPAISADNSSFVGWREKADTWPLEKGCHMQRSFTFP
jgi:hypothetical protein